MENGFNTTLRGGSRGRKRGESCLLLSDTKEAPEQQELFKKKKNDSSGFTSTLLGKEGHLSQGKGRRWHLYQGTEICSKRPSA